jgi:hypothetical protein
VNSDEDLSGRILDTLKKAERERSITRVPTPMTVSLLLYSEAEADCSLRIPGQVGHRFRSKLATDSGMKLATCSGVMLATFPLTPE